jgi:hypothetical protein
MSTGSSASVSDDNRRLARDLCRCTLWLLWQCVRVPLLLLLVTLEPVVNLVLGSLALLGVLTALFWELVGPPGFPFFLVLTIALGFQFVLLLYDALLRFLRGSVPLV